MMVSSLLSKYYVYRHIRLDTKIPFYIGKGSGNRANTKQHRNQYWHNIVDKYGYSIEIVKYFNTEDSAYQFENQLITLYKKYNLCKANLTLGGEGSYSPTEEIRYKMGNAMRGRLHSHQSKLKMSENYKSRLYKHSSQTIEKIRFGNKYKTISQEHKTILSNNFKLNKNPNWKGGVCTPDGYFDTIRVAANYFKCSKSTIVKRCKSKKWAHWFYRYS